MDKLRNSKLEFNKLEVVRGKDIVIPENHKLVVTIDKRMPIDSPLITNIDYQVTDDFEVGWVDKATYSIVKYNVMKKCLEDKNFLPELPKVIATAIKDNRTDDKPLGAGTDFQKALVTALYNFSISQYPQGLRGQAMEMYTGLKAKRVSDIISRVSCTYQEVRNAGMEIHRYKNKVVIDNKTVYFVKHTDSDIEGGYMPKWIESLINDYLNENYPELTAGMYSLDPEFRGSVG